MARHKTRGGADVGKPHRPSPPLGSSPEAAPGARPVLGRDGPQAQSPGWAAAPCWPRPPSASGRSSGSFLVSRSAELPAQHLWGQVSVQGPGMEQMQRRPPALGQGGRGVRTTRRPLEPRGQLEAEQASPEPGGGPGDRGGAHPACLLGRLGWRKGRSTVGGRPLRTPRWPSVTRSRGRSRTSPR